MILRVEFPQENIYQSTELQNISWSFVEMLGDSRPCDDFVQTLTQK